MQTEYFIELLNNKKMMEKIKQIMKYVQREVRKRYRQIGKWQ